MDNRRLNAGLRRVLNLLQIAALAALVWVVVVVGWLWLRQESIVFQPPRIVPDAPQSAERVEFRASDGHPLFGYLVFPRARAAEPQTVVIAFHGNADLAAWLVPWAQELADRAGVAVLLPEYRGYADIEGPSTYKSSGHDARGALAWAQQRFPGARVALFGHSLGSAVAAELARAMAPAAPAALVLQAPFTSARSMATRMMVPPIPGLWPLISRVHYDTRTIVADLDAPVWVVHGARDVVIPARMGRAVFQAARRKGELLLVPGAGHNDVSDADPAAYWSWLVKAVSAPVVELEEKRGGSLPGLV